MTTPPLRPVEILLVEDSPTDRLIAIEALKQAMVINNLHTVENGLEAMAYLRRQGKYADAARPDLILLDLNLPKKDGREVLIEIKQDEVLRVIPVVVLTTSDAEEDVVSSYGHHANSFIRKPVDFARFAAIVRSIGDYWFQVVTLPAEEAVRRTRQAPPARRLPGGGQRLRVLLIEDDPASVLLVRELLMDGQTAQFELDAVPRLADLGARADRHTFDVVLTDLGLPDSQGLDTYRRVRAMVDGVPVIVLTGLDDEAIGLQALQEGAQDYLIKGEITGRALARSLRYGVDRARLEAHLRQSQRLEAVGQLAAGVAHDFNNLLTIVQGQSLFLQETVRGADERAAVEDILQAAARGADLTRQLLTFSRRQLLQAQPLDLNALIGGIARMLRRLLGPVSLELQLTAAPVIVQADRSMLEQVIVNLAMNARDAMPTGGKLTLATETVTLERAALAAPDEYPGHFVKLTVADTGCGMKPEVVDRVFEPFFTTKEVGKGSGLGLATLATTHSIVQQHRGWIRVASELAVGTRFDIFLPASSAAPAPPVAPSPSAAGGTETVLVVDDEPGVRRVAEEGLRRRGYRVLSAGSGVEALRLWERHGAEIALLFTDLVMPDGIGGWELAARLREARPDLPVVYTSGYSREFAERNSQDLQEGVNFLQKPYALSRLATTVRSCLDRARS
jgi:CheY-like chemotaxis protein